MSPTGPDDTSDAGTAETRAIDWNFPFEGPLHEVFPALHEAHNAWMSAIDSLQAPDRKTHELIRMVVTVMLRNPAGVRRHAQLAHEVGATWDEIMGSIMLTMPGGGVLVAVEAIPPAREGFEAARDADRD
jgi:alkylhydroperoxidase/carboxymuconolactone decarboxylase family protein YurZ